MGRIYTSAADWWSFGVLLYEMLQVPRSLTHHGELPAYAMAGFHRAAIRTDCPLVTAACVLGWAAVLGRYLEGNLQTDTQ